MVRNAGLLGLLIVACGGTPPVQQPITAPPLPTAPPLATSAPQYDLSPVAPPAHLVLFARFSKPAKIPGVLSSWTGLPIPLGEALDEMMGSKVATIIDTNQPIDVAVTMSASRRSRARPRYAISAGVRSIDDAKAALGSKVVLSPLANGAYRVETKAKNKECEDGEECDEGGVTRACVLAPAFGSASARVVCSEEKVDELWPYMVRGATRVETTSDVHAEIMTSGASSLMTNLGLARELAQAGAMGTDLLDLVGDLDKIVFDANLDDPGANASAQIAFKQVRSPLTRLMIAHADKVGPPSAAFLKLPADSDAALWDSGIDAKEIEHAKTVLGDFADKELDKDGMPLGERKAMIDASKSLLGLAEAPIVWAKGVDVTAANAAVGLARGTQSGPQRATAEKNAAAKLGGWSILGVEQPIAKVSAVAKEWSVALARPGLAAWNKTQPSSEEPMPALKSAAVPKGLPADTQHFELTIFSSEWPSSPPPPNPSAKGKPPAPPKPTIIGQKVQLYLVPDGARTWAVWSLDDATAIDKAKGLLGSAPTLATRAGLDELRAARSNAGGFVTMRAIGLDSPLLVANSAPHYLVEKPDPLFGMTTSSAGVAPIPFWFAGGANQSMTVGARVSKQAIRDGMTLSRALRF